VRAGTRRSPVSTPGLELAVGSLGERDSREKLASETAAETRVVTAVREECAG
jgi:hypothetical protein